MTPLVFYRVVDLTDLRDPSYGHLQCPDFSEEAITQVRKVPAHDKTTHTSMRIGIVYTKHTAKPRESREEGESYGFRENNFSQKNLSGRPLRLRRKQVRLSILVNTYVPSLFRFINIVFTTAALGMAIRIQNVDIKYGAAGAVGSSP
ncbi:hypothetical protein GALMADRAFT_146955 [Galerina marginata CBS 339.88]|uniref:Uncharacterized protein n=1 Tax=Galerina marginata (strain CBS 339.88) TaxID=685588 RepID=A0A067SIW7_GALM3|nr:hypothetical protein GALMADRAFT_146955 [Galerina marginata CBS 339.88]